MALPFVRALAAALLLMLATPTHAALEGASSSTMASLPSVTPITLWSEIDTVTLPDVMPDEVWVSITLKERQLTVYRGEQRILTIPYLALGTAGASPIRLRGSSQTPTGEFHIERINRQSRFELFFGIDYPTPEIAREAWHNGILSNRDYRHYLRYRRQHGISPANTPLGGDIGIHGLGPRPAALHQLRDWTEGCIAITNAEIQALDRWVDIGTRVVIR